MLFIIFIKSSRCCSAASNLNKSKVVLKGEELESFQWESLNEIFQYGDPEAAVEMNTSQRNCSIFSSLHDCEPENDPK